MLRIIGKQSGEAVLTDLADRRRIEIWLIHLCGARAAEQMRTAV